MGIKHSFTSSKAVGADATKVRSNDWNDDHDITGDVDFGGFAVTNIEDDAYNATSWDGSLEAPTKNAIRDKIEALVLGSGSGTLITPRSSTLTIFSGAITVTASFHYVDTEASASFDALDTINGGADGQRVVLAAANTARSVHLRDDVGNILLGDGGFQLDDASDSIELIYDAAQAKWLEISRFGGDAYDGWKNVMDYGAVGNGVADDTAAIQAAFDDLDGPYADTQRGTIFFPTGTYKTTAPIDIYLGGGKNVRFFGAGGATVIGDFDGYIFWSVRATGINYNCLSFENLRIVNGNMTNDTSGGILNGDCIACSIKNCVIDIQGGCGVQVQGQCTTVDTCVLNGHNIAGSIGVCSGNGTVILDSDFTNFDHGVRHSSLGLHISGGRYEVNETAIFIGMNIDGNIVGGSAVVISGLSMESNSTACVHWAAGNAGLISGCGFTGGGTYALKMETALNVAIIGCTAAGAFTTVDFDIEGPSVNSIKNVTCISTSGSSWNVHASIDTTGWFGCEGFTRKELGTFFNTNVTPAHQIVAETSDRATISLSRFANSTGAPRVILAKSRGVLNDTGAPAYTVVQSGDELGLISFQGSDSVDFAAAGYVRCLVDSNGTPGSGDMPGRLEFGTTSDGNASPTARWYIDMSGHSIPATDVTYDIGTSALGARSVYSSGLSLKDGVTAPSTVAGQAQIYVDTADGDLKVKFGDGTVKTIVVDT